MSKPVIKSRTIWFNFLTLVSVAVVSVAGHEIVAENPMLAGGFAVAAALVNLGLRLVTKDAVR